MDARDYVVGVVTSGGNVEVQAYDHGDALNLFLGLDAAKSWARHLRRKLGLRAVVIQVWSGMGVAGDTARVGLDNFSAPGLRFVAGDVASVWGPEGTRSDAW